LIRPAEAEERNWVPMAIAAGVVLAVVVGLVVIFGHGKGAPQVLPTSTAIPISRLAMSESANLAGGKVTYLDGHIANQGNRIVTGITVQILFRAFTHEVTQNETQSLKIIRMRDPYIDVEPVSAAPLKPGDEQDFRLIFDAVSPDWDGAYPEIRIIHVDSK
jgi:negative regulator of sigma E activity